MLDIKFIRDHKDLVDEAARKKRSDFKADRLLKIDEDRVRLVGEVDEWRAKQNAANQKIKAATGLERDQLIEEMTKVKIELQQAESNLKEVMKIWQKLMLAVPNVPDMSVPEGDSDDDNQELRVWGERPIFSFPIKGQLELLTSLDLVDFERGAKVAGFRGYFLKNAGVELSLALWQYALKLLSVEGFTPVLPPVINRPEMFMGTGYLPGGEDDLYRTQDGDYLAGTSEVPVMGYHFNEIIPIENLPVKLAAWSPCFRREAGSHGKDTRGLIRLHEFYKVEQIILCEGKHAESVTWHEKLLTNAENLMQSLNLPYRVVVNCTGDLGQGQVKKYDIEAWVPSEQKYRETHSVSYFHDFQTRRSNIRYRDSDGKIRLAHSLNGTMAALPRLLVPLIENYQQVDGSIAVPAVLQPYLDGKEIIR